MSALNELFRKELAVGDRTIDVPARDDLENIQFG